MKKILPNIGYNFDPLITLRSYQMNLMKIIRSKLILMCKVFFFSTYFYRKVMYERNQKLIAYMSKYCAVNVAKNLTYLHVSL